MCKIILGTVSKSIEMYLTDFILFPLTKIFRMLQDTVRIVQKGTFLKGGVRWLQLFFIDFQLFYFLIRTIPEYELAKRMLLKELGGVLCCILEILL